MARTNRLAKRAKPTDLISHWPKLIENFQYAPREFYCRVEQAMAERQVPGLVVERVDWKEGGPLSPRREYLRLTRERLVFDICGAPFGTGFFISIWCGKRPLRLGWLTWVMLVLGALAAFQYVTQLPILWVYQHSATVRHLHVNWAMVLKAPIVIMVMAAVYLIVRFGMDLDSRLIRMPIVGYFYERYFRRLTLYRIDRTCMYQQAVHNAVMQVIDEITEPKGIHPLNELDRRPVMRDLFAYPGSHHGGNGRN